MPGPPPAQPGEQRLIEPEPEGVKVTDPAGVLDPRRPVRENGVIDRVPVTPELDREFVDAALVLGPHRRPTTWTCRTRCPRFDVHPDRPIGFVDRAKHGHLPKTNQEFTDANRVNDHRGPGLWLA
ncbi:MAG: hypothetical protein ACKVHU_20930 [Acidimicrobiales bacterium]